TPRRSSSGSDARPPEASPPQQPGDQENQRRLYGRADQERREAGGDGRGEPDPRRQPAGAGEQDQQVDAAEDGEPRNRPPQPPRHGGPTGEGRASGEGDQVAGRRPGEGRQPGGAVRKDRQAEGGEGEIEQDGRGPPHRSQRRPASSTARVCRVIGTGTMGTATRAPR